MATLAEASRHLVHRRGSLAAVAVLAVATALHLAVVVRDFSGPIGDELESFVYEYLTYAFSRHIHLFPVPRLELFHPEVLFPFGTSGALQSWCVERELFTYALRSVFSPNGPWLQIYYCTGLVIGVFGTYALLRRDIGTWRATACAIVANVLNVYAAFKYPMHHNMSVVHWAVLGIVVDYLLFRRVCRATIPSLPLVLLRALLVFLSFGLELGHVLGFALTSAFLTICCSLVVVLRRPAVRSHWVAAGRTVLTHWRKDARKAPVTCALLVLASLVVIWFYGILTAEIVSAVLAIKFDERDAGVWFSHPVRLLMPFFPWTAPGDPRFAHVFGDVNEVRVAGGTIGWTMLALLVMAIVQQRRHLGRNAPLLIALFMYVVSRDHFDLMRWLPWFSHMRVLSRSTVVYSTIIALLACRLRIPDGRPAVRRVAALAFSVVAALELFTVVQLKLTHRAYSFDDAFMSYMRRIEETPGKAVFDFPFCIVGGNGAVGKLCAAHEKQKAIFALQRFHHKDVIGHYLGRLHPKQVAPFVRAGWPKLMVSEPVERPELATRLDDCPDDDEIAFIKKFYEKNDFAGMQLAVDRLPPGCAPRFFAAFGQPVGEVTIPAGGRLMFIPRAPETRRLINEPEGRALRMLTILKEPSEFVSKRSIPFETSEHPLSHFEHLNDDAWRWALGPETEIAFDTDRAAEVVIRATVRSPFENQRVTVEVDGHVAAVWGELSLGKVEKREASHRVGPGQHTIRLLYEFANHLERAHTFAPRDGRAMALQFYSLVIEAPARD